MVAFTGLVALSALAHALFFATLVDNPPARIVFEQIYRIAAPPPILLIAGALESAAPAGWGAVGACFWFLIDYVVLGFDAFCYAAQALAIGFSSLLGIFETFPSIFEFGRRLVGYLAHPSWNTIDSRVLSSLRLLPRPSSIPRLSASSWSTSLSRSQSLSFLRTRTCAMPTQRVSSSTH